MTAPHDAQRHVDGVLAQDRRSLARAITLIESVRPEDEEVARTVLERLLPHAGNAVRVGITGVPGAGKSTLIEALGTRLVKAGHRLAVLAIDPSSAASGGSILGDKTRMTELSQLERAFVRPSPGAGTLGGVARRTREAVLLCEAAGHDVVFVETIGVGQSETAVADMVDVFWLLMLAGAGDDLQGIKRGVLELADVVCVTKADGDNERRADEAARELGRALHILQGLRDGAPADVLCCSAVSGRGLDEAWRAVTARHDAAKASGALAARRAEQDLRWFQRTVEELALARVWQDPAVQARLAAQREAVRRGEVPPSLAARRVLDGE